jgi:hypothetical protein
VFHSSRNGPAISWLRIVYLGANREPYAALDKVSGLLVLVCMAWQQSAFAQPKLGHEHSLAVNQGLSLDSVQGRKIAIAAKLFEHTIFLAVADRLDSRIRTLISATLKPVTAGIQPS